MNKPTTTDAAIAQEFIAIIGSAWMSDAGSGINYAWDGSKFFSRDNAIKRGFQLRGSDDFNIGVIENGKLVSLDWMTEVVDSDPKELAEIAEAIGLPTAHLSTETPATAHGGDLIDTVTAALITASTQHPHGETSGEAWRRLASVAVSLCTPPAGGFVVVPKDELAKFVADNMLGFAPKTYGHEKFRDDVRMAVLPMRDLYRNIAPTAQPSAKDGVRAEQTYRCDYCGSDYTDAKYCCQSRREYLNAYGQFEATTAAGLVDGGENG